MRILKYAAISLGSLIGLTIAWQVGEVVHAAISNRMEA